MYKFLRVLSAPFVWYFNLFKKSKLKFFGLTSTLALIIGLGALISFYYAVLGGAFGKIPSNEELKAIRNYQASEVYSSDSVLLGRYFVENRTEVSYNEVSPLLIKALIATEDARFYEHTGVDHRSLMRVLFKSIILRQHAGGGSTLSQQLVKNLFGRKNYGKLTMPVNKIKEAIIANKMEHLYTKQEILMLYLNTVSFGEDTYGIDAASHRFFSKDPKDLKIEEAAVLIGMLKSPYNYNPRLFPEKSIERRNTVISQLTHYDYISSEESKKLQNSPLDLSYTRLSKDVGIATHFREYLRLKLENWLKENPKPDGTPYNLYTDGLTIYTSIHSKYQKLAEESVNEHLATLTPTLLKDLKRHKTLTDQSKIFKDALQKSNRYKSLVKTGKNEKLIYRKLAKRVQTTIITYSGEKDTLISPKDSVRHTLALLQAGFLVTDPIKGSIKAWVGGVSFKNFQYDHVLAQRQVGSVFKPIVYTKALIDGKRPCDFIQNRKVVYTEYDDWTPKNSDGNYEGKYTLIGALTNSVNTISVKLLMRSGIEQVIEFAKSIGIKDSLPSVPSIALGVSNISLKNMIGAYSTFANNGTYTEPHCILAIYNQQGDQIYNETVEQNEVFRSNIAHQITNMLQSVVNNGTARRLRYKYQFEGNIAGKTGTTQNHTDGWFVGYTPEWLGGVWVGADNPLIRFSSIKDGQGANMALPIWANFYSKLIENNLYTESQFPFENNIDCELYKENSGFEKLFKKGEKRSHKTGFKGQHHSNEDTKDVPHKGKKKKFRLFKKRH